MTRIVLDASDTSSHLFVSCAYPSVKRRSIFAVATRCFAEPRAARRTPLPFASHNYGLQMQRSSLCQCEVSLNQMFLCRQPELMKRVIDDFARWFILPACQACWAVMGMVL